MPKKKVVKGPDIPAWVVTYGDLMSLLLCFFILLAAFSEMKDPDEFRKVLEVIREALGFQGGMGQMDVADTPANTMINDLVEQMKAAENKQHTDSNNVESTVGRDPMTSVVHDGNFHTIGKTLAFSGGSVVLTPVMQQELRAEVAPKIRDMNNVVRIVGHAYGADDLTQGTYEEVAFRRAQAVHEFLVNECGVDARILRIEAAGNAEPSQVSATEGDAGATHRRVQVYMTDRLVSQTFTDFKGTGRGR